MEELTERGQIEDIFSHSSGSTGPKVCSVVVCTVSLNVESSEVYTEGNDNRVGHTGAKRGAPIRGWSHSWSLSAE